MLKFLSNLLKVLTKKRKLSFEVQGPRPLKGENGTRNIKWIKGDKEGTLGIQKTSKGAIIHAINCELEPEEIMEIVKKMFMEGEL